MLPILLFIFNYSLKFWGSISPPQLAAGFQFDYVFDWTILKYQQSQIANPPARALVSDPQWL